MGKLLCRSCKRVVAAIEGGMSRNQAASGLGCLSTAIGWMQRVEQTGNVARQMGGRKPKAISGEHAAWLSQRIRAGDFTCAGWLPSLAGVD